MKKFDVKPVPQVTQKVESIPKAPKVEKILNNPQVLTEEQKMEARIQSRFNIGPTDYKTIGQDRDKIVEYLEKNTHVDPRIARAQVDEFFDGPKSKVNVKRA